MAVEYGQGMVDGSVLAAIDWEAAIAGVDAGRLPCSSSEEQMLRLAASIADGVRLDLGSALSGLDEHNVAVVAGAVLHAAGHRKLGLPHPTLAFGAVAVSAVTLTRPRHPFEGRSLQVMGSMRRHGVVELLVVLPDGSKRLIPAAWTDLERPAGGGGGDRGPAATLGSVSELLHLSVLVSDRLARTSDREEQAARKSPCKEDDRAAYPAQSDARPAPGATRSGHRPASRSAGASGDVAAGPPDRQGSPPSDGGGRADRR